MSRAVAQLGSAPDWGSGGRRFKSCQPDNVPRISHEVRGFFYGLSRRRHAIQHKPNTLSLLSAKSGTSPAKRSSSQADLRCCRARLKGVLNPSSSIKTLGCFVREPLQGTIDSQSSSLKWFWAMGIRRRDMGGTFRCADGRPSSCWMHKLWRGRRPRRPEHFV